MTLSQENPILICHPMQIHLKVLNRLDAEAFYLTRDIEKYGSWFIRVRGEIKAYPTMEFRYKESGGGMLVSLTYQEQKISALVTSEGKTKGITKGITEGINSLRAYILSSPGKQVPQLAAALGLPAKTVEPWVADLKRQGCIEYRGSKKAGGYFGVTGEER